MHYAHVDTDTLRLSRLVADELCLVHLRKIKIRIDCYFVLLIPFIPGKNWGFSFVAELYKM